MEPRKVRRTDGPDRDAGNILPMVLVMTVIIALILVPTLGYASTVMKAGRLVGDQGRDIEAVRAGARIALADPFEVFSKCKPGSTYTVSTSINEPAYTSCSQVGWKGVTDAAEIPYGTVALQLNEDTPVNAIDTFTASTASPVGTTPDWWFAHAAAQPTDDTVWTSYLPPIAGDPSLISDPDGYPLPAPFDGCTAYFPGRFEQPLVLDGPTYFASGVYYFEESVTVVGGADVVVGMGTEPGCIDDYDIVSVVEPLEPLPYGGGGTFIFGDDARLVVDDNLTTNGVGDLVANTAATPLSLVFNKRYVAAGWQPDARVSVLSVNGDIDGNPGPPASPGDLVVPNVIEVPLSEVSTSTGIESAIDQGFVPSTLTAEPRPPEPPTIVAATAYKDPSAPAGSKGVIDVRWAAPDARTEGGSLITEYVATASNGATCISDGALGCVITGLPTGSGLTVTVTAENALGISPPSAPSATVTPNTGSPNVGAPDRPDNVTYDEYDDAVMVSWDPPSDDGSSLITGYDVAVYRVYKDPLLGLLELEELLPESCSTSSFRGAAPDTECLVNPLADLPPQDALLWDNLGYRFKVTATNAIGTSTEEESAMTDIDIDGPLPPIVLPPVVPVAATYEPDPIVDIDTSGAASSVVRIVGYIGVPQGRIDVEKTTDNVSLRGGIVAGSYGLADDVATQPGTLIGFEDVVLQRTVQLVTTAGNARSTMTVQINESGDYVVNSWVIGN